MQRKFISRRSFLKCAGVGAVTAAAAGLLAELEIHSLAPRARRPQ